jgi:DNA modification methylase
MMNIMGRPGAFFLSPFAGSGNSMIAAAINGMLPLGCDTSEKYLTQFYLRLDNYFME